MRRAWLVAGLLPALGGCGSLAPGEQPPAATAVPSPVLDAVPAGRVFQTDVRMRDALSLGLDPGDLEPKPPPARRTATADGGRTRLTLQPRLRRVVAAGRTTGTVGAGVGPAQIVSDGRGNAYVTDAVTDGVTVLRTRPALAVTRRVGLPGGAPWAIAYDRDRNGQSKRFLRS